MAGICTGKQRQSKIPKNHNSSILAHSYLSSRGLVAKTPDSHIENWGSNPAGGKKTACIFCLNFETFRRFCDFLRAIESSRPTESEKIKVKNIRTQFFSEWICIFTLKFFSFLYSKFKQIKWWLNIETFLSIFGQKCIQNCPKVIKLI